MLPSLSSSFTGDRDGLNGSAALFNSVPASQYPATPFAKFSVKILSWATRHREFTAQGSEPRSLRYVLRSLSSSVLHKTSSEVTRQVLCWLKGAKSLVRRDVRSARRLVLPGLEIQTHIGRILALNGGKTDSAEDGI